MKKVCLWAIAVMFLICGLGLLAQPSQAAYTPADGDLIKTATDPAIYYIGSDSKRHLYVNEVTFWTWYEGSWSNLKSNGVTKTITVLSQADFDNLEVGANAKVKPGAKLVKFQNSPKIYTSVSYGQLAPVPDDATAKNLFGDNWSTKIITIQNGFETDYTKDGVLTQPINYFNRAYGFSLQFPATWSNYQVRTEVNGFGAACFYFGFPTWTDMFGVCAYTETQWNELINSTDTPDVEKELKGDSGAYKFTTFHTQEVGDESLMWASNDIPQILETFNALR